MNIWLIGHLDVSDAHHAAVTRLLIEHVDETFGASPITLAETFVGPARMGRLDQARAVLERLEVAPLELDEDAPIALAKLRAATALKMPDCCVLLAAEALRAGIATFDDGLAKVARKRGTRVVEAGDSGG